MRLAEERMRRASELFSRERLSRVAFEEMMEERMGESEVRMRQALEVEFEEFRTGKRRGGGKKRRAKGRAR